MIQAFRTNRVRPVALLIAMSMLAPFAAGCGGHQNDNIPPPVDNTASGGGAPVSAPPKAGMSTGKKVVIALAGAALLYYLVKHHQQQNGQQVQYYKSKKNGRIYYRDPKTHQAHWVTPAASYEVPADEAQEMKQYQGYNNQTTGSDYEGTPESGGAEPSQ
jgi:hypothetical protein